MIRYDTERNILEKINSSGWIKSILLTIIKQSQFYFDDVFVWKPQSMNYFVFDLERYCRIYVMPESKNSIKVMFSGNKDVILKKNKLKNVKQIVRCGLQQVKLKSKLNNTEQILET